MSVGDSMTAKKSPRTRPAGATPAILQATAAEPDLSIPLRGHTERALHAYLASLDGDRPARLYDLVLREVEEPLFRTVLDYASGNQSRAADILGINRGTLRKKLRELGLSQ
jgi:Fis family transcriptional regulator, factor for inversion stimulation protein